MSTELSENSLDNTVQVLTQHCKNKERFKKDSFLVASGGEDSKDYTNKSIRRSRFSQKNFIKSIFKNSAAAGSAFAGCVFDNCSIINANFQECTFINSSIINNPKEQSITHSNFNESLFSDDFLIENTYFEHSVFYQTAFIGGKIRNTNFYSCTLEGTTFSNVIMDSVQFTDLNIDYAVFENVRMHNVILPFSQICYTFGLLSYLNNTTDEVFITSAANENGYITKEEFLTLLPHFLKYYTETREYFPVANIYFFQGEYNKAKEAIKAGILLGVAECDFRRIKYLCKLISTYSVFNFHERGEIYDFIYSHIAFYDMHPSLLYNYTVFKKEIESYLLNNNRKDIVTATIKITTDVFHDESEKMGVLLSGIEEAIDLYKSTQGEHTILCRHNSAVELTAIVQDILPVLLFTVPAIYYILMGTLNLEEKRLTVKEKKLQLKNFEEKNKLELEGERIKLEKAKRELGVLESEESEKQNAIKREILRGDITNHDIKIKEMNHIMIGNIPTYVDRQLIQYTFRN